MPEPRVYVAGEPGFDNAAMVLAQRLRLPIKKADIAQSGQSAFFLLVAESGLTLHQAGSPNKGIRVDFAGGGLRHRRLYGGGKNQQIAKAVGIGPKFRPLVADLTAGLGRDGFALASLGAEVILCERHPVVFALLEDGVQRAAREAAGDSELARIIDRMHLKRIDALGFLEKLHPGEMPDVIYLDPMFPARDKSAQVKKEMAIFQHLLDHETGTGNLLNAALGKARFRVVVKRPLHAAFLEDIKPGYSIKGSSTRFDIYPIRKVPR